MSKRVLVMLCLVWLTSSVGIGVAAPKRAAPTVSLVTNGAPSCAIIVPREPGQAAWFGAGELQSHIEQITGAKIPILTDDKTTEIAALQGTKVFIGETAQTRQLGFNNAQFAAQQYMVKFLPNTIILMGHDEFQLSPGAPKYTGLKLDWRPTDGQWATLYAVYDLLEKSIGVRWYAPGAGGTSLPPLTRTLTIQAQDIRRKPAIAERRTPFGVNFKAWGDTSPSSDEIALFHLRNKFWRAQVISHSFNDYPKRFLQKDAPQFEAYHPEYFAQGHDTIGDQLCFTNPGLIAQVVKDARDHFDGKAERVGNVGDDWIGLVPLDTKVDCKDPNCQALLDKPVPGDDPFWNGSSSRLLWTFTDKIAREIAKTHPNKFVGQLAYADYLAPPANMNLAPNIYVGPALDTRFWPSDGGQQLRWYRSWVAKAPGRIKSLWLYPCFPIEYATTQGYHSFPVFEAHDLNRLMRMFASDKVGSFMFCGAYDTAFDYWCVGKFQDDPTVNVDALMTEFFPRYYGHAATPMLGLYRAIEATFHDTANYPGGRPNGDEATAWDKLGTAPRMARWQQLMNEAEAAARTDDEKRKVANFKANIWTWMVEGKKAWNMKKTQGAEVEKARNLPPPHADVMALAQPVPGGDAAKVDWKSVPVLKVNRTVAGYTLDDRLAELQLAHDGQRLYGRIVDHLDTAGVETQGYFWGDRWEWFLSTQRDKPYRQVGLYTTPKFDLWTSTNETWKPDLKYASFVIPHEWTALWSIPLKDISAVRDVRPGDTIYMNFIRGVRSGGGDTLAWSPTFEPGRFHNLPRMAEFKLLP